MAFIKCTIYKDRKEIFSEVFDNDYPDAYIFKSYYFGKALYEDADMLKFKILKSKSKPINGQKLPLDSIADV